MSNIKFWSTKGPPENMTEGEMFFDVSAKKFYVYHNGQAIDVSARYNMFYVNVVSAKLLSNDEEFSYWELSISENILDILSNNNEFFLKGWPYVIRGNPNWIFFENLQPPTKVGDPFTLVFKAPRGFCITFFDRLIPLNQYSREVSNEEILDYAKQDNAANTL